MIVFWEQKNLRKNLNKKSECIFISLSITTTM